MQLIPVRPPGILPTFVSSFAARLIDWKPPDHLAAGRECARRALEELGHLVEEPIRRGAAGEPLWPGGITGSITHKDGYVWAAVARTSDARSIGIDSEWILEDGRATAIARAIALPEEASVGQALAAGGRVSLLFSLKESIFKCLYPLVRTRFYYEAVAVRSADPRSGKFRAELLTSLPPLFEIGHVLSGRFTIGPSGGTASLAPQGDSADLLHSCLVLPASPPSESRSPASSSRL